jgi:hypothetical protein
MSNCHLVAARSLIDLVASRLALRAPALRAATALTWPSRSARRLPYGRQNVPTAKTIGPNNVVANHCVEHGDHLTHHRHDHDLRQLAGGRETVVERRRFVPDAPERKLTPVRLPPGRFRLATRPSMTGSPPVTNTIGTLVVAALAPP